MGAGRGGGESMWTTTYGGGGVSGINRTSTNARYLGPKRKLFCFLKTLASSYVYRRPDRIVRKCQNVKYFALRTFTRDTIWTFMIGGGGCLQN